MLTRTTTAGMGDYYGACYGHPNDPRAEAMDEAMSDLWFVAEEGERKFLDMKAALRAGDQNRAEMIQADIHELTEPM